MQHWLHQWLQQLLNFLTCQLTDSLPVGKSSNRIFYVPKINRIWIKMKREREETMFETASKLFLSTPHVNRFKPLSLVWSTVVSPRLQFNLASNHLLNHFNNQSTSWCSLCTLILEYWNIKLGNVFRLAETGRPMKGSDWLKVKHNEIIWIYTIYIIQ